MNVYQLVKEKFILPHAYEDWKSYRTQVTTLILQPFYHTDHNGTLTILGAGRCNDIDLPACVKVFSSITLIDEDADALTEAVKVLPPQIRKQITLSINTLSGISSGDTEVFCNTVLQYVKSRGYALSEQEYVNYTLSQLSFLKEKLYKTPSDLSSFLPAKSSDLVVCLGVHSQLFSILAYCLEILDYNISQQVLKVSHSHLDYFQPVLHDMIDKTIPLLNQAILEASTTYCFIGCEYNEASPVAGAYQSILDIRNRTNQITLTENHLKWSFNPEQNIVYDMLLQTCLI